MPTQDEIGFTKEQKRLLAEIHAIAVRMEGIKNDGKVHAVVALLEEMSKFFIDEAYFMEKTDILFREVKE